jgi:cobyrinic acid a,c-diamide synthase
VQAHENQRLEAFLEGAAAGVARETNLDSIVAITCPASNQAKRTQNLLPPLGQTIAIARDEAFAFAYQHLLDSWRKAGAELSFFSPLQNEPPASADAVFLPGGYPELHAGRIAGSDQFLDGIRSFKGLIYGECGGYMVLGDAFVDADGERHIMGGLLPLETSFAQRKLHLGYRQLTSLEDRFPKHLRGHEFHYATISSEGQGDRLFNATTANGTALPALGLRRGNVMGSFAHIIGVAP